MITLDVRQIEYFKNLERNNQLLFEMYLEFLFRMYFPIVKK